MSIEIEQDINTLNWCLPETDFSVPEEFVVKINDDQGNITEYLTNEDVITRYKEDIKKYPLISREEEIELGKRIKEGNMEARNDLCNANLRFVFKMAKKYSNGTQSFADVLQDGNIGLVIAADKFDYKRGVRYFITSSKIRS